MSDPITFDKVKHSEASLGKLDIPALVVIRNAVGKELGASDVKTFKDHTTAVNQTWKALVKHDKAAKKAAEPPKERKTAKPAESAHVKRPTRRMFSQVTIVKPFDGNEDRSHRSVNYKSNMLVMDAIEGEGTLPWDIYNWEKQGYMKVVEPNDAEYAKRRAAWYSMIGKTLMLPSNA